MRGCGETRRLRPKHLFGEDRKASAAGRPMRRLDVVHDESSEETLHAWKTVSRIACGRCIGVQLQAATARSSPSGPAAMPAAPWPPSQVEPGRGATRGRSKTITTGSSRTTSAATGEECASAASPAASLAARHRRQNNDVLSHLAPRGPAPSLCSCRR